MHRALYRVRFVDELSTSDAWTRLGVPRSTYHHRLRRAIEAVDARLDPDRFAERQVKLLGAYVAGVAYRHEDLPRLVPRPRTSGSGARPVKPSERGC